MAQDERIPQNESLYSLYRRGMELLEEGDFEEAAVPLKEAARLLSVDVPFLAIVPAIVISICVFPLSAWIVSRIDAWRLRR